MEKIKRRDFMKLVGMAVIAPRMLAKESKELTPSLTNPIDIFQELTGCPDFPQLRVIRKFCDEPIIYGKIVSIKFNDRPLSDYKDVVI